MAPARRSPVLPLLVAAGLLLGGGEARAIDFRIGKQPFRLDITESLFGSYRGDNKTADPTVKNYGEVDSRLNLQLSWWRLVLGLRFDTALYINAPEPGDRTTHSTCRSPSSPDYVAAADRCLVQPNDSRLRDRFGQQPFYPEKTFLTFTHPVVDVTLGDYYAHFGRGLVLSLRKVDELGIDTTLRGAKVIVHHAGLNATVLAGWSNIQNVDETRARFTPDPHDFIAGAHVDYNLGGAVIGAHAVGGVPSQNASQTGADDRYLRYGVVLDLPKVSQHVAGYAEYAHAEDQIVGRPSRGDALYAQATAFLGRFTLTAEYKDYRDYRPWRATGDPYGALVYQLPPTLERVVTQYSNNTNITAGRLTLDVRARDALLLYASVEGGAVFPAAETTHSLVDVYGGVKGWWNDGRSHFFLLAGYRREHNETSRILHERLVPIEWDAAQVLPRRLSLELSGQVWLRDKPLETVDDNRWVEGHVYLALKWVPHLIASVGYEFTTSPSEALNQQHFVNGSLQWNITPATSLRLFGGGQRPGIKCVSGLCRDFPSFQGARLEVVVRL